MHELITYLHIASSFNINFCCSVFAHSFNHTLNDTNASNCSVSNGKINSEAFSKFYRNLTCEDDENGDEKYDTDINRADFPRLKTNEIEAFKYYNTDQFNTTFKSTTNNDNDLKTINLNIRGLSQNYDNLTAYLSSLETQFDIIILTECHLQKDDLVSRDLHNKYPLNGYNTFYVKSTIRYGGVLVYVKSHLKTVYINNLTQSNTLCDSIYLKISDTHSECILAGYYRHCIQNNSSKEDFINFIDEQLSDKNVRNSKIIYAGDLNICLLKSACNNTEMKYLDTLISHELEQHIFYPTRIQHYKNSLQVKSLSLIDHIASNFLTYECKTGCLFYPYSDHYGTFLIINDFSKGNKIRKTPNLTRRNYKSIDKEKLKDDCANIDWESLVIKESNIDKCFENIINETENLLDLHAPLEKISKRKAKHYFKPWINAEKVKEIKIEANLYGKYKKNPNRINSSKYKSQKNKVTNLNREGRNKYFSAYFEKYKNNVKKTWDGINLALNQTKNKKTLPGVIYDSNNKPVRESKNKAKSFAKYFENVPSATIKKIPRNTRHFKEFMKSIKPNSNYFNMDNCTVDEVKKHIMQLKSSSSPGPLKIPNQFLKLIGEELAYPLHIAINKSMSAGYFPSILKIGKQTPVHKAGEHHVSNFRPITVCNSFAKILEKVVRDRLNKFVENNKLINNYQFGFRKAHSTAHATINLLETALEGLDNNLKTGGVYLDISKAFDTVNHDILIAKLEHYGIRKNELMWFQSYLSNRVQYVEVEGEKSHEYVTNIAVPQGGTLSAMLFILFTNDIVHTSKQLKFSIYADDTSLIISIDREQYDCTLKNELNKVIEWFSTNLLLLNVSKTEYSHFGPNYSKVYDKYENGISELHQVAPLYSIIDPCAPNFDSLHDSLIRGSEYVLDELAEVAPKYILDEHIETEDGTIIINSENVKYLGLQFDNNLNFQKQISIVNCKISRMIGAFWRLVGVNTETKKLIYHSLVESHLNYGIMVWGSDLSKNLIHGVDNTYGLNHIPKSLKLVDSNLKKVIRAIFRKPKYDKKTKSYTESSPLYKTLKVFKLPDLYYYNLALLVHDYFYNPNMPVEISEKFSQILPSTQYKTRSDGLNLVYAMPNKNKTYKKPTIAGVMYWNRLPLDLRKIDSKPLFKNKLKDYIIESY